MSRHDDDEPISSYTFPQPNEWQIERGYDPNEPSMNPKARFHANGKYATGIYKKWLEENQ
tara:strand:- start:201 stop:380 length:180 start_codon:yes stop_codon:yes gene_type:complete